MPLPTNWPVNIPANAKEVVWMRSDSVSGGKDWIGIATDREFITHWGKTGHVNQSRVKEKNGFLGSALSNLMAAEAGKSRKGYWVVARMTHDAPAPSLNDLPPPPSKPSAIAKAVEAWQKEAFATEGEWF